MADEEEYQEENINNPKLDSLLTRMSFALLQRDESKENFVRDVKNNKTNSKFLKECNNMVNNEVVSHFFIIPGGGSTVFNMVKEIKPDTAPPKRCWIFFNQPPSKLTEESINNLIHMEVGGDPLNFMYNLSNEIFVPILQNKDNQQGWTDLISKDLMEKLNNFNANLYLTIGQKNGKTLLPLPPKKILESSDMEKDKADIFNNSIITWMKQIRKVLETEPEQNLKAGKDPGPDMEIEFWKKKAENLNSIHEQLKSESVSNILKTLRASKSTYASEFEKLEQSIRGARQEANYNYMYLRTLSDDFKSLKNTKDFQQLPQYFMPIMKVILLIWERSTYYNKAPRLVVLIREICNQIIEQANEYVPGSVIFGYILNKEEVPKACSMLQTTIDVCAKFKDCFYHFKSLSKNSATNEGWSLHMNALFNRLDSFLERCHDIMHISDTILQFNKLENMKIGGTKGKNLTTTIAQIYEQFKKAVEDFHNPPQREKHGDSAGDTQFDIMDISNKTFDEHFFKFRTRIKELERRLAAVITQSFDDTDTLTDKFRLLDSFDDLLKRPIIQDELEKKHIVLIETYKKDLKTVQEIFVEYGKQDTEKLDEKVLYKNLPNVAGALNWTKSLKDRIRAPLDKLAQISPDIQEKEEYKDVAKMKKAIEDRLTDYEEQKLLNWQKKEGEGAREKLDQMLLAEDKSNKTLKVNFDPSLIKLLREVKYLKMLEVKMIPAAAEEVYSKSETYRRQVNKLDQIVDKFNFIITKLEPVEEPLITNKIDNLKKALKPGIEDLKWRSPDIDTFINAVLKTVNELFDIVSSMKADLEKIRQTLANLNIESNRALDRKKTYNPEEFYNQHSVTNQAQTEKIKNAGKFVTFKIKEITDKIMGPGNQNTSAFKKSKPYKDYQEFINDIVIEGLCKAICNSLAALNSLVDVRKDKRVDAVPLFDIKLDIVYDKIQYEPDINNLNDEKSIRYILNSVVNDYVSYASKIDRVDTNVGDYINEMHDNFEIRDAFSTINENVNRICEKAEIKKKEYEPFKILWTDNPETAFKEFLTKGLTPGQAAADDEDDKDKNNMLMTNILTKIPPFDVFESKIEELKRIKKEVSQLSTSEDIDWLKVNSQPLKSSLENKAEHRIGLYTNFFLNQIKTFIKNCQEFENYLKEGTKKDPAQHPEDTNLLKKTMEVLAKERVVSNRISDNIKFMKKMVDILKKHDVEMRLDNSTAQDGKGDDFLAILEEKQNNYNELVKNKVFPIKTSILPLKQQETVQLKQTISQFSDEIAKFRATFLKEAPFKYDKYMGLPEIDSSYDKLDAYYEKLQEFRKRAKELNDLESLFELEQTKYKQINECQVDIEKLKTMWDLISVIRNTYDSWLRVPWKKINVGECTEDNTKFLELIKKVPREVKQFEGYAKISEEAANMKKIIEAIGQLSSGKLQKRHWVGLSKTVGQTVEDNNPNFCFETMVKLEIHKFLPQVTELNDTAIKEANIEKTLKDITKTWSEKAFTFESFQISGEDIKIPKQFDEIQNDLSTDNLKVLSLLSQGKSVEIFKADLDNLKARLGSIDDSLVVWEKVQKNWKRLVNIFMLSEDIRNQLPEATKVFEQKNGDFRNTLAEAVNNPIMYDLCSTELKENLDGILKGIETCEKQLNQYLEQKKKIFPRFYFVSNQTLIDILSNGNNPTKIASEYLGDLFDGLKKLIIAKAREGDLTVKCEAMYSKDDEVVPFFTPFEPTEAVEIWLNKLEYKMRETLEAYLSRAKKEAEVNLRANAAENPNSMDWIFNYCAQIALLAVQIIWTEDVQQAFDDIEGGMSTAMRTCLAGIVARIMKLIQKVRGNLTPGDRAKIITIITVDVHSRDAVETLARLNINDKENFKWTSQLKFFYTNDIQDILAKGMKQRWEWEEQKNPKEKCVIRIVDQPRFYSYEYVGNCGRLVITPLTDRCYITLTQALGLCMGGAPAGPAGTGKTETTKDLGRAVGLPVFVFNCSEQMSTDSLGQNFMGLSQTGAWGCFDEFNRISIEVLSVVSTQVKQIQDALKVMLQSKEDKKEDKFMFMEEEISLADSVGLFITMNPGYAGRTELPESLKALFRSCAMVVPDLVLICENMLLSEGYEEAKELAKKFVTIYILSRSLLSKQKHYDWGLRAVKSVLRQAGKLKRDKRNVNLEESPLLMRALRDFNMPKIYIEDRQIFKDLLRDLFQGKEAESVMDEVLDEQVRKNAERNKLIPEPGFSLKCVQLSEILEVRHCVFVIGPPGCGKSTVWKTLINTYKDKGQDAEYDCLDPKAVTSNELFGVLTKTKEFKNGVLSSIIRNQSKEMNKYKSHHQHKWSVLDGDIDPEWIESLNTVMDDNKVLTLVSNDRFPLNASMRLVFEISNLRNATPATVSRAGVLYINDSDIGWKPYFESWINSHKIEEIKEHKRITKNDMYRKAIFDSKAQGIFYQLFDQFEKSNDIKYTRICPVVEMELIQTTCAIIEELVLENYTILQSMGETEQKAAYEGIFYFAAMWGYGGGISMEAGDESNSYVNFNNSWKARAKIPDVFIGDSATLKKPIYDFYYDVAETKWKEWAPPAYEITDTGESLNFLRIFVPTVNTTRMNRLIQLHVNAKKPILFVGSAGTGKTAVVNQYLISIQKLVDSPLLTYNTNFSSKTSSASLQESIMTSGIRKLGTRYYGLSGQTLIFFIDDFNMPYVDKYNTQSPIALIRQIIDYGIVYDRDNLEEYIKLQDLYFCGCMNPKAGSFNIELRLQRHFSLFAAQPADDSMIKQIYKTILDGHFGKFRFTNINFNTNSSGVVETIGDKIIDATKYLFASIVKDAKHFSPTAQKFHYQFNLRDLSRITEGLLLAPMAHYNDKFQEIIKLWVHECRRVFEDRLMLEDDILAFKSIIKGKPYDTITSDVTGLPKDFNPMSDDNIFTSFISGMEGMDDGLYLPIKSKAQLAKALHDKLIEYNENNSNMDLVLFDEAIQHICRIARIIERPAGNALLIGVGGSGKQSLTRLAAFLQQHELQSIKVTSSFSIDGFKEVLGDIFKKVTKPPGVPKTIMATDAQLSNENILIYLNEILNSGYIAGLWVKSDLDGHLQTLRNEAKNSGFTDSLYLYFIEKVRKNLHVCLCMSPVGDTLRIRARKFPGIVNQSQIDWFHSWPQTALHNVALNFLKDLPLPEEVTTPEFDLRDAIAMNMAETHIRIDEINKDFLAKERRRNYTTPKSFLELIDFYKSSYIKNSDKIGTQITSLQKSLEVLKETNEKVAELRIQLEVISKEVEEKSKAANELVAVVNVEKAEALEEQTKADIESAKTNETKNYAEKVAEEAKKSFEVARPILEKAQKSLENLEDSAITEMGKFSSPTPLVLLCGRAILFLLGKKPGINLRDDKNAEKDWPDVQKMMKEARKFKQELLNFAGKDGEARRMTAAKKDYLRPLAGIDSFNAKDMVKKSIAAANLVDFLFNIIDFSDAFQLVQPLEEKAKVANAQKEAAIRDLEIVLAKVAKINAKVAELQKKLDAALEEKRIVEEKKALNLKKMLNAEEMVNGLKSNQERWSLNEQKLRGETLTVIGDTLLAAEFVSYIGPFSAYFRLLLWRDNWLPNILEKKIPITDGIDPMAILTNSDSIAKWKNEGLPEDQMSIENAAIITSSNRWPLIIDPQLQGGNWINGHVANPNNFKKTEVKVAEVNEDGTAVVADTNEQLLRISLNADKWENKLEEAIVNGRIVLLENVTQDIDPLLDPLLSRSFNFRKGSSQPHIMFNRDDPIYYHRDFRLFLQCKLSNPHFKPETSAQCSIINFIVTESGLEDQLLAVVVDIEKPELERKKTEVMKSMNDNAMKLAELDNKLLLDLSKANPATILDDVELMETLNNTKTTSKIIEKSTEEAKITEKKINEERNNYRPVAAEGSMLYFLIISLNAVNHMYQYSLESFQSFFNKGINTTKAQGAERIEKMVLNIRLGIYQWISRGLFEKHKIIFMTMMTLRLMTKNQLNVEYTDKEVRFLLTCIPKLGQDNPVKDWLKGSAWNNTLRLADLPGFEKFPESMGNELASRFKEWYSEQNPEIANLPPSWKNVNTNPFKKLLVLRALRPDRMIPALSNFIRDALPEGPKFVGMDQNNSFAGILESSYEDATQGSQLNTPIFFILSPGADPVREVEKLGLAKGFSTQKNNFFNISLGQGQDIIANSKLDISYKEGCWIMLQNIHLMPSWLPTFEKTLDKFSKEQAASERFRLFVSAEPSTDIPIAILEKCIKLTNEPPAGLKANMKRAWTYFPPKDIDEKDMKFKAILFALCYFHSTLLERRKFGAKGWNMFYPFNIGDLRDSAKVLENSIDPGAGRLPWADFKYIFGEIMYGGHIVDDWDRRLCSAYLENLMMNDLLSEDFELLPYTDGKVSLRTPAPSVSPEKFLERIESALTDKETPLYYGLHPNAEINLGTVQCTTLFETLVMLQPDAATSKHSDEAGGDKGQVGSPYIAKVQQDWTLKEKMFNLEDIRDKTVDNRGPYQNVFLQECEYMNYLIEEICSSIEQLRKATAGELTYSEKLEKLEICLNLEKVPDSWADLAYPAKRSLATWFDNLIRRIEQLSAWKDDPLNIPRVTKVNLLFNPQSFLTAIKQVSKKGDLNKLDISTEFTKKPLEAIDSMCKDGAYCYGFLLDGASWDWQAGAMDEAKPKEMYSVMPVCQCRAVIANESDKEDLTSYKCPVYRTEQRGNTYIFTAQLRTPSRYIPRKWVLAGVAIILDVEGVSDEVKETKDEKK
jgi:dynein heavy chain